MKETIGKLLDMASPYSRRGLEGLTALVILTFSLIFCHIFIIPLSFFETWPKWLLHLVIFVIFYLLRFFLFSGDKLYYGNPEKDKYVRAFQMYWPSKLIATKFNMSMEDAKFHWFETFNTWKNKDHPRHSQWERTMRRGYACRFVYYCIKFFEVLLWVSVLVTSLQEVLLRKFKMQIFISEVSLEWRIGFIIFVVLFYITIRLTNKTSPTDLIGVWRRFAEINKMHRAWIDNNISTPSDLLNP